ncbi:hypothetical protein DLH98_09120 [Vibrio parahaemolyticus]|uniref:Uncharacterized protein n=1 Tax=Vibrio diabolicus TaxID=50719 RepID=A0AAX1XRQ0_9VIBR|nr:hypothetical protein AL537_12480 [Vibrio diabolicus]AVF64386.1 hypothetical protein AL541_06450 [Vibrio alginolyticus]EGQ8414766.1 hypothetical protein [Vibrio parahaemolyticus]AVF61887.1 hypothetical protein AL537_21540 [Vibrio diabolicus]EGQ8446141.1 hypothetical protein [Vibrio alginolyticus]
MLLFHVVPFGCTRLKSDFMKQGNGQAWK